MRLLLDTHACLWFTTGNPRLSERARLLIGDPANERFISIASIWEMSIKYSLGKLTLDTPFGQIIPEAILQNGFRPLSIEFGHVVTSMGLPMYHRDPFDRLLIGQAMSERLTIVSADRAFADYQADIAW